VFAVTVCAIRSIRIFLEIGLSMAALEIVLCDLSMTIGTIHPTRSFTGPVFLWTDVRMTFDTGDGFMG
jgi:hypothetical protein